MTTSVQSTRTVERIIYGKRVSDGAGVQLKRVIGSPALMNLDPFLLFDEFGSTEAQDYIAGFPEHPHRGFQTVTYMLEGNMRHRDSKGHSGLLTSGGVQWMNAGRGILHSEMPEQEEGLMRGFQLWVNLPAAEKMSEPSYQEYAPEHVPSVNLPNGVTLKVIAGKSDDGTEGAVKNVVTQPLYLDVQIPAADTVFTQNIFNGHASFVYAYEGSVAIDGQSLKEGELAVLADGDLLRVTAQTPAKFLVVAGKPLNEPIVQSGPFVMNTVEEIQQAHLDYRNGTLA